MAQPIQETIASAFKPAVDVIVSEDSIFVELVLPGVDRDDVKVERIDQTLVIHGVRRDEHAPSGGSYHFIETPRGPFRRAIPIPFKLDSDPPVELDRGVLRIRLTVPAIAPMTTSSSTDDNQAEHDKGELR